MYYRALTLLIVLSLGIRAAHASHIRGGEITARRLANTGLTYEFTLSVYIATCASSQPVATTDTQSTLFFGDGTSQTSQAQVPDIHVTTCEDCPTDRRIFKFVHTYPANGVYTAYCYKSARNANVINFPNAQLINFYVETQLSVFPALDVYRPNSSPVLEAFAVDKAKPGEIYIHNPAAYDVDGDSLSYAIIASRGYQVNSGVSPIFNYTFPQDLVPGALNKAGTGPSTLTVDERGIMRWDCPRREGEYNVALVIYEWRFGQQIGYVVRDMQIIVKDAPNQPPVLKIPQDTCVIANRSITKKVTATDPDAGNVISLSSFGGGVFTLLPATSRATFISAPRQPPVALGTFTWQPGCLQVRNQPYYVSFKAVDGRLNSDSICNNNSLADIQAWGIRVVGPPPDLVSAIPGQGSVRLTWASYVCQNIDHFNIYRRADSATGLVDSCKTGATDGYVLVGSTSNGGTLTYVDNDSGRGLGHGQRYCYRVTAQFAGPNVGESLESNQLCVQLKLDLPLLTNVSVERTDSLKGQILVRWIRPRQIDTIRYPSGYRYDLFRALLGSTAYVRVVSYTNLRDTSYVDTVATNQKDYVYKLVFTYSDSTGLPYKDSSATATNVIAKATGGTHSIRLNWSAQVPWNNGVYKHAIHRRLEPSGDFILLDSVPGTQLSYVDDGSIAGPLLGSTDYYYYVTTRGAYSATGIPRPLDNKSYLFSARLKDTIPPCPPSQIKIAFNCLTCEEYNQAPAQFNVITWQPPNTDSCIADFAAYNIYYKPHPDGAYSLVGTTRDTIFRHNNNGSLAGVYRVTSIDNSGNENIQADSVTNDNCVYLDLPNVFTDNGDTVNTAFKPRCITRPYINTVDLRIYSRWGQQVYSYSGGPDIVWEGKDASGNPVPPATYYYRANVRFIRLRPQDESATYKGWVEVLR